MLVRDDLPELGADLIAALAALDVDDLAHCGWRLLVGGSAVSAAVVASVPSVVFCVFKLIAGSFLCAIVDASRVCR